VGAHRTVTAAVIVATLALGACGSGRDDHAGAPAAGDRGTDAAAAVLDDDAVTVGSFDFPESELLAEIYGRALQAAGFEVRFEIGLGPREFVQPALSRGLVELVPEYAGTALRWITRGTSVPSDDVDATTRALRRALRERRMVALAPSPAQDANAVVVTRGDAIRYSLHRISDLAGVADQMRFGGPPGCPDRPFCLGGIEDTYDLRFADFLPLDVAGPLTHQALAGGHVDVALLFSTDPRLLTDDLVVLEDDRNLQPAENVTPVVRQEVVDRWGDRFVEAVDAVSARLSTARLQELNGRVVEGEPRGEVAAAWLASEGLA
jgi:osmoprotectant transport system substrate-binding protein